MRRLGPSAVLICLVAGGCVNGPVRYGALGDACFATVEFPAEADAPAVPFAAVGGLATDGVVAVGDTVAFAAQVAVVAPIEYVNSQVTGRAEGWTLLATPVMLPVLMITSGIYRAVKPADTAMWLGWSEGPYGETREREAQRAARQ